MKTALRALAVVCITVFSLMVIGFPVSLEKNPAPPGNYAYLGGQLAGGVLLVGFLFFSVRWYMTLSGRTHRVSSQTWAAILFWYSGLGVLMGLFFLRTAFVFGASLVVVWGFVGFACWKWKKRLRAAEKTVQASVASAV